PVMKDNFVRLNPGLNLETRMFVIPNGYDAEDFSSLNSGEPQNDKFTITYTGALYERRKPDQFLEAVGHLVASGMVEKSKIRVRFIGSFKHEVMERLVEKNGLKGCVDAISYMQHDECLKNMLQSDAMLLIEGGGPGSEAFYTGKIFEYIQTGRPILAVIPAKGAAAGLIDKTKTGLVCDWSDVTGIEKGFLKLYQAWQRGERLIDPDQTEIARYDRRALTKSLSELLNRAK
ncbi:MAG: glycosyl transferase, partial [Clostridia bacterium]|nr:glycosyl transferase [Clostridia bacterium]